MLTVYLKGWIFENKHVYDANRVYPGFYWPSVCQVKSNLGKSQTRFPICLSSKCGTVCMSQTSTHFSSWGSSSSVMSNDEALSTYLTDNQADFGCDSSFKQISSTGLIFDSSKVQILFCCVYFIVCSINLLYCTESYPIKSILYCIDTKLWLNYFILCTVNGTTNRTLQDYK